MIGSTSGGCRRSRSILTSLRILFAGWAVAGVFGPARPVRAAPILTYITGDVTGGPDVIFRAVLDPEVPFSAAISVAVTDTVRLDGIDFVPGSGFSRVGVGSSVGAINHYNVHTGAKLASFVPSTDAVVPPPASPGTQPSTILPTATHLYYVENQFGIGATTSHRIMRTPIAGPAGAVDVVFDGADAGGLENFEGLNIRGGRLFFFARDPGSAADRALLSIGLDGSGLWDGGAVATELGGLTGSGPTTGPADGSDELHFDPDTGLLFGSNIVSGEVIAYDPSGMSAVVPPGGTAPFFISPADVASGDPLGLGLLSGRIDGLRTDEDGNLIFVGLDGVIGALDIAGVLADGADDGDVTPLYVEALAMQGFFFDDLTTLTVPTVPEPSTLLLCGTLAAAALAYGAWRRRTRARMM